jgi:acetyltransferase-like isoleucine patch superfamily enzyme
MPLIKLEPLSQICIGDDVVMCSRSEFTALSLSHGVKISTISSDARISVGNHVGMSGSCIVCASDISIGSDVLLGANTLIVDTDFHPIAPLNRRHSDEQSAIGTSPVTIGNNVFVGVGATILKGVKIGDDSVVAAGAIVIAGHYPPGSIIGGNPAKIIGSVYTG